jgi:hypothetical protein
MGGACNAHGETFIQGFCGEKWTETGQYKKKYSNTRENNIKLDIKDIEMKVVDWIHPARLL